MEGSPIPTPAHNLPAQLIPIVGREKEISDLISLLKKPDVGLITLHGLGGTGKTRLAVELGRATLEMFPDGVWFVALAPLNSADYLFTAAAAAMDFTFQSHDDQKSQFLRLLHGKKLLLIFDNLEHLLPESSAPLESILQNAPDTRLLVTSRQPINTPWEWVYPLHGLDYGYGASKSQSNKETPAAVQLFLQHLSRIAGPAAGNDSACATQICEIVRGLPLALLLAASWGRALECEEIVQELQSGIGFLQSQQKAFPERHSSMQAVFDYSWRLLSDHEQAVLRKLSIFRGGFDRNAALEVAGADLTLLAAFIDKSFVDRVSKDRYQIHELLRQYLQERLMEVGEETLTRDQHLAYYTQLASKAGTELMGGQQKVWLARLQIEIDNIRTALDWILASGEASRMERGLRMMASLERFWLLHTYAREGYGYLMRMLEHRRNLQAPASHGFGRGLNLAAKLSFILEDLPATRRFAQEAFRIGLELNDSRVMGDSYFHQAVEAAHRAEFLTARPLLESAIDSYRQCDYLPGLSGAIEVLGRVDFFEHDFPAAFSKLSTALDLARKQGNIRSTYTSLRSLGQLGILDPQVGLDRARHYYAEALHYARDLEDKRYIEVMLSELAEIERLEGKLEQAAALLEEADLIAIELGEKEGRVELQVSLGFVYLRLGKYDQSQQLFTNQLVASQLAEHLKESFVLCLLGFVGLMLAMGKAQQSTRTLGALDVHKEQLLLWPTNRMEYERIFASVKAQLAEKQFNELYKEGQALSLADAAQLVQLQGIEDKRGDIERLNQLTKREIEILRLVAQGLTDAQIADRLVLSPRTVNAHVTSVYRKLDVNSRATATRFAIEHGLA